MRANITRTITETTIKAFKIGFENGNPVAIDLDPIMVYGEVDEAKAVKMVKKVHGKEASVHIREIITEDVVYEISRDDFIAHATRKPVEN